MRKIPFILILLYAFLMPSFAHAGSDLAQTEQKAIESAQWFKAHFPEAMIEEQGTNRLMQHSVEEIPTTEVQ